MKLHEWLACSTWLRQYNKDWLTGDLIAALVVTFMLIPQSLAYALVAGLPPEVGLYASMAPLVLYAIFGSSRTLSVGPVAITSLMSAAAAGSFAQGDVGLFYQASVAMALIGGGLLCVLGMLRMGFVANLLSHPVIAGFVAAAAVLIAVSQLGALIGVPATGNTVLVIGHSLIQNAALFDWATMGIGVLSLVWIIAVRRWGVSALSFLGFSGGWLEVLVRLLPALAIVFGLLAVVALDLTQVKTVGHVPSELPAFLMPQLAGDQWLALVVPASLIALVGFVEAVSVGHSLAAKRKQRIEPNQELLGLGAANLAAGFSGGFSVTAGFSRSVVNFDAGAQTPMAGVFAAAGMVLATLFLTPWLAHLPHATLAAIIIVSVLGLIDWSLPHRLWKYSRRDFSAYLLTVLCVLGFGVELGILVGVVFSILALLAAISQPHWAQVGQVPGTEHFRNELRHKVNKVSGVVSVRVDESLYFPNAMWLEDLLLELALKDKDTHALVLQCSAVNHIDASALESLMSIDDNLQAMGITLYLSEVKGPITDKLKHSDWYESIHPRIALTHLDALRMASNALN